VPFLDVVATSNPQNGQVSVFILNRDLDSERELILDWGDATPGKVLTRETLTRTGMKAFKTFENPKLVAPRMLEAPKAGAKMTLKLPPRSYSLVQFG
jgi:alpha-L-arabinofuranosidase